MSKPLLTVRCIGCDSEIARVVVMRLPEVLREIAEGADWPQNEVQVMIEFRTQRLMKKESSEWKVQRARGKFQEPLGVSSDTGFGRSKAYCKRHYHWLDHSELQAAIRSNVGVLKLVPDDLIKYSNSD